MPRQKPRYPLQLDNWWVDIASQYGIQPFELEMLLVSVFCLSPLGDATGEMYRESVSRMCQKLSMSHINVPTFTIAVQAPLK